MNDCLLRKCFCAGNEGGNTSFSWGGPIHNCQRRYDVDTDEAEIPSSEDGKNPEGWKPSSSWQKKINSQPLLQVKSSSKPPQQPTKWNLLSIINIVMTNCQLPICQEVEDQINLNLLLHKYDYLQLGSWSLHHQCGYQLCVNPSVPESLAREPASRWDNDTKGLIFKSWLAGTERHVLTYKWLSSVVFFVSILGVTNVA